MLVLVLMTDLLFYRFAVLSFLRYVNRKPNDATIRSGKRHGTNDVPYVFVYRRFWHVDVLYRAANDALSLLRGENAYTGQ